MSTDRKVTPTHTPEVTVNTKSDPHKKSQDPSVKLPHERDESANTTGSKEHPEMKQAFSDIKRGLKDTDERGKDGRPLGSKIPSGS